jgi:glucose-6-phosphate isomerase/transaldolase/glucose-6-phosphate isomerase
VLDSTAPESVLGLAEQLNLGRALFVVASKSGETVETLALFQYFYNRVANARGKDGAGGHFLAITDPGTPLAGMARLLRFRDLFLNDPQINGRFAALSYFGLVPAVLAGVDVARLLSQAAVQAANANGCNCARRGDNEAIQLGAALGAMAAQGRDKVTFLLSPALAPFGAWVEHLLAVSLGQAGKGLVPVVGDPLVTPVGEPAADLAAYGDDRLFVMVRLDGDGTLDERAAALAAAGQPLITLHVADVYEVGGLCFMWQMATAVTAHLLQINPFTHRAIEAAKKRAAEAGLAYGGLADVPDVALERLTPAALNAFLAQAAPGDYVGILAFVPRTAVNEEALQRFRAQIFERTHLPVTVAYGPRYLHSTGQLHKEGPGEGLFIQLVEVHREGEAFDVLIPPLAPGLGGGSTFGVLTLAQAVKDAQALRAAGRPVIAFQVGADLGEALAALG